LQKESPELLEAKRPPAALLDIDSEIKMLTVNDPNVNLSSHLDIAFAVD